MACLAFTTAAVILMRRDKAESLGLTPMASIVGHAAAGVDPKLMGYGPVPSTEKLLSRLGLRLEDVGLAEVNEAFAAVPLYFMQALGVDPDKVNLHGAFTDGHVETYSSDQAVPMKVSITPEGELDMEAFDKLLTPRQPGSTLKPFLYAAALENGWTAATLIDDSPLTDAST